MKELTPQETLQAIAEGNKLECRWFGTDDWRYFNPLENRLTIESIFSGICSFRLYRGMITIGDVIFPKPESEPPELDTEYWIAEASYEYYATFNPIIWVDDSQDRLLLKRGLVHLSKENAIAHGKALVKQSGGTIDE